jgi:predicted ATP-grasp superfamily ATP-dependent carboligase
VDLLLIAQSTRKLAQSAARAGLAACAIDHFADADTRRYAARCLALTPGEQGFDESELLVAAGQIAPNAPLVYGSGPDNHPDWVEKLAQGRPLLGNSPKILRIVINPRRFFALLDRLDIPYPEIRFSAPACLEGWLVKPGCGEGGKRVGFAATKCPPPKDAYYQRRVQGEAYSVLFLADGKASRIIGFNTQWISSRDPSQPFLFAGALNRAGLDEAQRSSVAAYAEKLTLALGLVGMNGLDFMIEDGLCRVLELNPRPSATMALYDADFDAGLLAAHIAACQGRLPDGAMPVGPVRALRILFAPRVIRIGEDCFWHAGCADIPNPGTTVYAGQPLCSLMAEGGDRGAVVALLDLTESECLSGLL